MRSGLYHNITDGGHDGRSSYHGLLPLEVDVLGRAEVVGQRQAVEVRAYLAVVDGEHVEQEHQEQEEGAGGQQAHPYQEDLFPALVLPEGDERQQGVGEEEAEDETEKVGVVVHPGQQAYEEEEHGDGDELAQRLPGMLQHRPRVQHFHDEAGQQSEL